MSDSIEVLEDTNQKENNNANNKTKRHMPFLIFAVLMGVIFIFTFILIHFTAALD